MAKNQNNGKYAELFRTGGTFPPPRTAAAEIGNSTDGQSGSNSDPQIYSGPRPKFIGFLHDRKFDGAGG